MGSNEPVVLSLDPSRKRNVATPRSIGLRGRLNVACWHITIFCRTARIGRNQEAADIDQAALTNLNVCPKPWRNRPSPRADLLHTLCKTISMSFDWSSEIGCFTQSQLLRPKPVRRNARRVFALGCAIDMTAVIPDAQRRSVDTQRRSVDAQRRIGE